MNRDAREDYACAMNRRAAERCAQLQAAVSKARGSAPLLLNLKAANCDGYLDIAPASCSC
jgi:hypothetical protein